MLGQLYIPSFDDRSHDPKVEAELPRSWDISQGVVTLLWTPTGHPLSNLASIELTCGPTPKIAAGYAIVLPLKFRLLIIIFSLNYFVYPK